MRARARRAGGRSASRCADSASVKPALLADRAPPTAAGRPAGTTPGAGSAAGPPPRRHRAERTEAARLRCVRDAVRDSRAYGLELRDRRSSRCATRSPTASRWSRATAACTWREFDDRAARLAGRVHRRRASSPTRRSRRTSTTATSTAKACTRTFKMRGVPVNVNYRYLEDELVVPARQLRRRGAAVPRRARRPRRQGPRPRAEREALDPGRRRRAAPGVRGRVRGAARARTSRCRASSAAATTSTSSTPAAPPACRRA